ncbi:DUF983 domain-containing protein [Sphingobium subterraneum]|uniref:Uncharacterized protein (DUF983 family) n=1 Tax=Sphingobium subterraneum TaxID=627688 RepID=A0A841J4Z0_9SPHN|nr:DUF983 domain-containing protein [Sphingobium subterraneum]MBB6123301.1 uncharacterized protein (DUF983 family) [Sphingobium subterraneum]
MTEEAPQDTPLAPVKIGPLITASAQGLCPRCGARTLFASVVAFSDRCRQCGLDFTQFNVGDGPAAFLTMIIGAVMLGLALALEFSVHPPLWLHVILWAPLTIASVIGSLRIAKGALLALEYRNRAREGVLVVALPESAEPPAGNLPQ